MKIAFNPSTVEALTTPPNNKDITFDLRGRNIFARGVKFCGTDTNTWRDIKINNVSIGSNTLDLRNGSNTTLTNTNGVVTINSTWRPVVDNLTSDSTTSSLSANQGRVLVGLINGKSDSDHNHDDRYLRLTGGTMNGNARIGYGSGNLYIGNSGNDGWVAVQDICSQDSIGDGKWSIRVDGTASFQSIKFPSNRLIAQVSNGSNSPLKGIKLPSLGSDAIGLFSRVGNDMDEGGIVLSEDTCVIYNSFDTGWGLSVRDKDLNQTDISSDDTVAFGIRENYKLYSKGGFEKSGSDNSYVLLGGGDHKLESTLNVASADTVDGYHASSLVKFYLSPMANDAPADSAKSWFINTMPSASGAIVYNVPGSEKTIIAGKSSGSYGHMLQLNYDDTYLRILRYYNGSWKSTDWEKISAGYADSAGSIAWDNVTGKPTSFTPSSHTHSWDSITDKLVAGNEFNIVNAGFKEGMWFNYLPINDRSKTATITGYHFGNGATGYTSINASGFIKNGSSSSYVLLGDGGHQTISSLSVNYANSAGSASNLTVHQYLSNTDTTWWPLIWGGSSHNNTSDSTGKVYKSYDKLSWQTSSQTLYATNIQTNNIKSLSIGGGIYWNPYVESATDGSDAASITLVRQGVAGGTTLVLSQMNDSNDTIQFQTNGSARLYHNSYPILTTQNTYVSNNKGYINGAEITQVNNSDTLDNWHKDNIQWTGYITSSNSLSSYWFKMYQITVTGYQYNDITITFLVSEGYSKHFSIFHLKIRQNGTNHSGNYNLGVELRELVGNLRDKVVAYYNNSTGDVQLWGNPKGQFNTMNYTVLKKTTRIATDSSSLGILTAQSFSSVQTPPSTGYTKVTMARVGSVSYSESTGSVHWNNVTNKPSTFAPAEHTHTVFKNNLMIKGTNGTSDSASIHLGIGDSDTGFKWISDGVCQIYANNVAVGQWTSGGMNWFKNPTVNGNKVWNAGNDGSGSGLDADTLDGYHENSFLRYRGATSTDQEATLWNQIGIKQYNNALPDNLTGVYNYGSVISLPGNGSRFEIYASHYASGNGLYYRSGWGSDKKTWLKFIDSSNIGSQSVNYANSAGNADTVDGVHVTWSGELTSTNHLVAWEADGSALRDINPANVTVGNADKLDGYHASSFVRAGYYESADLNKLDTYSFIKSVNSNNKDTSPKGNTGWYNVIQAVHRNGNDDGPSYMGQIALGMTTNRDDMFFRTKYENTWNSWKTVIHSGNYTEFINNYYWANVKISTSSSTTTSPTVSNLTATSSIRMGNILLEHTDEINNITNGGIFLNYRNSGNVSLCYGGGNVGIGTNTPAYKLDVNGQMRAGGFHHSSVNSDNYMLLAGGGYSLLKTLIFTDMGFTYADNNQNSLRFYKLSGLFNNLIWVDGYILNPTSTSFQLSSDFYPYLYAYSYSMSTIYRMDGNNMITIDGNGKVVISCQNYPRRVGFFYTGRA